MKEMQVTNKRDAINLSLHFRYKQFGQKFVKKMTIAVRQ